MPSRDVVRELVGLSARLPASRAWAPRDARYHLVLGGLIGGIAALALLPAAFVTGHGDFWERPTHDYTQYLTTWEFFVHDRWRVPLLAIPAMGYPEGGSVLFTDALPIAQLASKVVYSLSGTAINPFGSWIALCYILQGVFAVRVVHAAGARSLLASTAAAVLAVGCQTFIARIGHIALSSHFLILWALALYVENVRDRRFTAVEQMTLSALALLVNAYLFVMVGVLQAACVIALWRRRALTAIDWRRLGLMIASIAGIGLLVGYGAIATGAGTMRAAGFGVFSWNLATLLVPPETYWGYPLGWVRDATGGQAAEGDAYVGIGAVMLLIAVLALRGAHVARMARRQWPLLGAMVLCAAYAASHRVYFGPRLVLDLPMPAPLLDVAAFFRASGRFVWVLTYPSALMAVVASSRWLRAALFVPLVVAATLLQAREATMLIHAERPALMTAAAPALLDVAQMKAWMSRHERVFQFPSWSCGGLWDRVDAHREETSGRELQLQLLAARSARPINTMYTSRQLKDCQAESKWAIDPKIEPGVLYILSKFDVPLAETLTSLAHSSACVDVAWGYVCSTDELTTGAASVAPSQ